MSKQIVSEITEERCIDKSTFFNCSQGTTVNSYWHFTLKSVEGTETNIHFHGVVRLHQLPTYRACIYRTQPSGVVFITAIQWVAGHRGSVRSSTGASEWISRNGNRRIWFFVFQWKIYRWLSCEWNSEFHDVDWRLIRPENCQCVLSAWVSILNNKINHMGFFAILHFPCLSVRMTNNLDVSLV